MKKKIIMGHFKESGCMAIIFRSMTKIAEINSVAKEKESSMQKTWLKRPMA